MLSFEFEFKKKIYYGLARIRESTDQKLYAVTIMNGDLECLLYGKHLFCEKNGLLSATLSDGSEQVKELQESIGTALSKLLVHETVN